MKWKTGLLVSLFLLVTLTLAMTGFWATGGRSLVNLYFNYLSQDLPDKKYSQADFVERRDETQISGYYAFTLSDNIYIWTLSGLKRYRHLPSNSVYYYMDVCGLIRANGVSQKLYVGTDQAKVNAGCPQNDCYINGLAISPFYASTSYSYPVTGLMPNTAYYFRVVTYKARSSYSYLQSL